MTGRYLLAFDTSNEVIALGLGRVDEAQEVIEEIAAQEIPAHRASNTQLLPAIEEMVGAAGIAKTDIACVVCGRGPGSFTGVRICLATAKGIASALEVPLYGISTLDVIAVQLQDAGYRGVGLVAADAMRKEVYPVRYELTDTASVRLEADSVVKAETYSGSERYEWIAGDALTKYANTFAAQGPFAEQKLWAPTGRGLLLAAQELIRQKTIIFHDRIKGDPAVVLPVYTRLSDAEENERIRLSGNNPKDLASGVQANGIRKDQLPSARDTAVINARTNDEGIVYRPLDAAHAGEVALLESRLMGSDAWGEKAVAEELPRKDRIWWAAYSAVPESRPASQAETLIAYGGGWVIDGELQILKIATIPEFRQKNIARTLLHLISVDARDVGAIKCSLEVRLSNQGAQAFYENLGLQEIGVRPGYYSDHEDAVIMAGPLPLVQIDVAGMELQHLKHEEEKTTRERIHPLILALETSCDETAAAVVDGEGFLLSNVLASQVDFHARFGGVVPEIASRKHIEAICGVSSVALESAAESLGVPQLRWKELDAVACTYAPGLVGALVVGVAFAKGAAWAADLPFIGVNHLEGHIYANKVSTPDIEPPLVVSLVSGGHTMLVHAKNWGEYETLGSTLDDAVGEAFDKVAKAMGLGYPGGPAIARLSEKGNPKAIDFPRAMLHSGDLQFSLSGLKTAVISYLKKQESSGKCIDAADVAASFQQAVIDVQVSKAKEALKQTGAKELCLGGGVAANKALRRAYEEMCAQRGVRLTLPPLSACTDNAGMIALVALDRFKDGKYFGLACDVYAQVNLDEPY